MAITIDNPEFERILAEAAAGTGRDGGDILIDLLKRERARLTHVRQREIEEGRESARILRSGWNARPLVDPRPVDGILAYDENGLPC